MSKYGLDAKAKQIACVIDVSKGNNAFRVETLDNLDAWLREASEDFAYIIHDLDVKEDGTPKVPHIHLFARLKVCQRLYTSLNKLADALGMDNEQISIQKCTSVPAVLQYMLHKNNPDKHQYPKGKISTSLDEGELDALLEQDTSNVSVEFFVAVCSQSRNIIEVIRKVGLDVYRDYRNIIMDIWKSCHNSNYVV